MLRPYWLAALLLTACGPGMYTRAEVVYAEPAQYEYVVPVDRVVVVSREVLVERGYTVYRVETDGPNRIVWARRHHRENDDDEDEDEGEVVRVFVTPRGDHVLVRGLTEHHDRGKHKGWSRKGRAEEVVAAIDVRLRREH
ncbi:MAG TPA: hypothetical protein VJN39_03800 [Gemmatimonadales bacterium]|nr:hypothetical protein [Gemmatimonadales bacterium]